MRVESGRDRPGRAERVSTIIQHDRLGIGKDTERAIDESWRQAVQIDVADVAGHQANDAAGAVLLEELPERGRSRHRERAVSAGGPSDYELRRRCRRAAEERSLQPKA